METLLEKPTKKERAIAKAFTGEFEKHLLTASPGHTVTLRVQGSPAVLTLPTKAMAVLYAALKEMANGHSVTIIAGDELLSTQQAAGYLRVSRPHLIKLLEKGEIPFTLVGKHRRVQAEDVEAYKQRLAQNRNEHLAFLAKQAQELNLGY